MPPGKSLRAGVVHSGCIEVGSAMGAGTALAAMANYAETGRVRIVLGTMSRG
jgi:hypothetical protein